MTAVVVVAAAVPILYDALAPRECPPGISGMDCLPISFSAVHAAPAAVVVLCGALLRRAGGSRSVPGP